ncbi:MAG: hypothetical protein ABGW68_00085 [Gammaproteobacteria bacterium]
MPADRGREAFMLPSLPEVLTQPHKSGQGHGYLMEVRRLHRKYLRNVVAKDYFYTSERKSELETAAPN